MPCPVALALVFAALPPAHAPDATYDSLLSAWMQLRGEACDFKLHAESYLQLHRKDTWARVKANEFKLEAEKGKAVEAMKRRAGRLDLSQDITLTTRLTFGKYDFTSEHFPLTTATGGGVASARGTLTAKSYWFVKGPRAVGSFPPECRVFFANPELLAKLHLVPDAAERLLAGRKEGERVLSASVRLRLVRAKEKPGELVAEVQSVTFTDTIGRKPQLLTVTKPTESTMTTGR